VTVALTSARDRDVLRSFARRIDPSDAGAHNNLGVLYYNKGLYQEAVSAFMKALELDPSMRVAQRNLEIAYFNTGYYDTRIPELRERLRQRPDDRESRWELGRTFALLGQQESAAEEFRALLKHAPDDVGALLQLALAEKQSGDIERAQGYVENALRLDPSSSLLHFTRGEILYHRGLNEDALRALERSVELNAENYDALYLMGFVLGDLGRHSDAQSATRRAVRLNPSLSRAHANLSLETSRATPVPTPDARELQVASDGQLAHYNLGLAFRSKGYFAEALREYGVALERGEARDLVLQSMAEMHLLMHQPKDALVVYEELLTRQAESPKLWNERGVALHQEGRYGEAQESYRRSLGCDPKYAIAHNNLGVALFHGGAADDAMAAFRTALDLAPSFVKASLNLALLLQTRKRFPQALDVYRHVLTSVAEHPVAWNGVGLVLAELRKFEDARNAFARAIQARPDYAEAHYNMSFTLSNLGDFEGALRETKRALELDPYYVAQKFELAMDVEYEDPDLSIKPDLGGGGATEDAVADFNFDPASFDGLFSTMAPAADAPISRPAPAAADASSFAMATDFLSKGLYDRASAEINRAIGRGNDRAEGLALLGDVYAKQGLFGEALERYQEALRARPKLRAAVIGQIRSLLHLGRASEARPSAERLLADEPRDCDVILLTATACAESGDPAEALSLLDTARRVGPMRPDVRSKIGDIARSLGDHDGAITAYRDALQLDSDLAVVRYHLAQLLQEKGQNREAEAELAAAIDTVPTYADAILELATLRRRLGYAEDAVSLLVDLLQRDPYHLDALIALGEALVSLGRDADAAQAFARVLRFDPLHVAGLFHVGTLLADRHRYRDAVACWERVVDLAPATDYGRRARREIRTATELGRIFAHKAAR